MNEEFAELINRLREVSDIRMAEGLLGWDQQTYIPAKGHTARARQIGVLSSLAHERLCSKELNDLLQSLSKDSSLSEEQQALLREAKRDREKAVKVPHDLVRDISQTAAQAHSIWVQARKENNFSTFEPILAKLVELKQKEAEALGYDEDGCSYDALLDAFEPRATVKKLNPIIETVRDVSVAAVKAISQSKRKPKSEILRRFFSRQGQQRIGNEVTAAIGFDFEAGRIDEAVHPFTSSFDPQDVRLTTRYDEDWLPTSLFGLIHEAGHGMYEQGLPVEHVGTPLGEAVSLGIHESQSRFWENQIGRSLSFWKYVYPGLKEVFPTALGDVNLEQFHFAINTVAPSLIRVEADEVTYNLHIIIRYEIEQDLFSGKISVSELPKIWNEKMEAYLGIRSESDTKGVLQDIHWSFGGFGYFPTYLLGNLYAAQWMAALRKDYPNLDEMIANGEFSTIRDWMREKIHKHGRRYTVSDLARLASGEDLNPDHFANYLKDRFAPLYDVSW